MTSHILGSKSKLFLGQFYTLCFLRNKNASKSLPALMKYTQTGNYNTQLNNPQKAGFTLKQVLIPEVNTTGSEIFYLT